MTPYDLARERAAREVAAATSPLRAAYLEVLRHPGALRRDHGPAHLTASGLVIDPDGTAVLLVLHRKVGLWLQPGGHVEAGDASLVSAAVREAEEETGVRGLAADPVPLRLDRHPAPCGVQEHLDVQFLLRAPERSAPGVSAESLDVRWWPVDGLPRQRVDLAPLVADGVARLRGG